MKKEEIKNRTDITSEEKLRLLDDMWEKNKERMESSGEGNYISIRDTEVENLGVSLADMQSPGTFYTFPHTGPKPKYRLRMLNKGKYGLYRS